MEGLERQYLIGFIVVALTFIVAIMVFFGFWKGSIPIINEDKDIRGDCGRWLSAEPSCVIADDSSMTFENYASLKKAYFSEDLQKRIKAAKDGGSGVPKSLGSEITASIQSARAFCQCNN